MPIVLTGCQLFPSGNQVSQNGKPAWIHGVIDKGVVCSQDRGIYSRDKAESLAINNCLIQLTDKKISGSALVNKNVNVNRRGSQEAVNVQSSIQNEFVVQGANGNETLSYNILAKYFDVEIQRAYVWIELR